MQATTTTTVQHRRAEQCDFETPNLSLQVAEVLFAPPVGHPIVVRVWLRQGQDHDRREDGTIPAFVVESQGMSNYAEDITEARRVVRDNVAVCLRSFLEREYGGGEGDE